jgi:hypothetical protein
MAVHAICEFCGRKFSAALELSVQEGRRKHETSLVPKQAQEHKQAKESKEAQSRVQAEPVQPPQPPSPAPDTATSYAALRTLRPVFIFLAYLLGIQGIAVGIILFHRTADLQWGLLFLVAFFEGTIITFCVLRLLAAWARLGADLGDMESRMLGLLFEMRDKLDNLKK